jgi:hypothetical protein
MFGATPSIDILLFQLHDKGRKTMHHVTASPLKTAHLYHNCGGKEYY